MNDSTLHADPTCPECGDIAWTKCWSCGWEKPREPAKPGRGQGREPGKRGDSPNPLPDTRLEKEIETGIVQTLQTLQWAVYRTSQPRASMVTAGLPDLWVAGHGTHGWLEVKRPKKGRMSDAQSLFQQVVTENGGRYAVVRSEEEAAGVVNEWRDSHSGGEG